MRWSKRPGAMPWRWLAPALALAVLAAAGLPAAAQRNLVPAAVELRVPGQPAQRLYGESHALVVGASKYRAGWSPLPGVPGDVAAVSALLKQQGFEVTQVIDPTRDQLDAALRNFAAGPGQRPDNRLLVYFAGHGHTLTSGAGSRLGYIVPVDAPRPDRDPGGFRRQAYSMELVEVIARQIEARHALFLFDSCFSGTIFRSRSGVPDSISDKTARPVRQFITAGDADQPVPDESIFRRQLEAALGDGAADLNRDGYVTGTELGSFLEDTVTNYSRRSQTPRWGKIRDPDLDKGDFVFALAPVAVASSTPAPRPAALQPGQVVKDCDVCPDLVAVPGGTFQMGSADGDDDEKPVRTVRVAGFLMGRTEVTQGQWKAVMGSNPSYFSGCGDECPVEQVSWHDAQKYAERLSQRTGKAYRLPSEAEWEYAARAGSSTRWSFGDDESRAGEHAWTSRNSEGRTHRVAGKRPNAFGLYDMAGNVWEWVQDCYDKDAYGGKAPNDGRAYEADCLLRGLRGGSWDNGPAGARSAGRGRDLSITPVKDNGFRLARMLP